VSESSLSRKSFVMVQWEWRVGKRETSERGCGASEEERKKDATSSVPRSPKTNALHQEKPDCLARTSAGLASASETSLDLIRIFPR